MCISKNVHDSYSNHSQLTNVICVHIQQIIVTETLHVWNLGTVVESELIRLKT